MIESYQERGGDRRREQLPFATERRVHERRTGIDVREISGDPTSSGLSQALEDTDLSPVDRAIFEMVYARSVTGEE